MNKEMQGFTLIEIMIVVTIISIVMAISIPIYQNYITRVHINSALREVSSQKTAYELKINNNYNSDSSFINHQTIDTQLCEIDISFEEQNGIVEKAISCKLKNKSGLGNNPEVYLSRTNQGLFVCYTSDLPLSLIPKNCITQ